MNTVADVRDIRMLGSEVDYDGDGNNNEGLHAEVEGVIEILHDQIQAYAEQVIGTPIVHDPGGYKHNAVYMLQGLHDSLEDLGVDMSGVPRASFEDYPRGNVE